MVSVCRECHRINIDGLSDHAVELNQVLDAYALPSPWFP